MVEARVPKAPRRKPADCKLSAASVRKLARTHTEAALQVLAEVAIRGNSEASRISAAMALLDRGYGKSGTGPPSESGGRAPVLYHRIELIDGTEENSSIDHQGDGDQNNHGQD